MSDELRRQRSAEFFAAIGEGYNRYSRIRYATVPRVFNPITDSELAFSQIGVAEEFEDDWYVNPSVSADMVFYDIGRAVAIGEDDYLMKKIQTTLSKPSLEIEAPREKTFEARIQQMRDALGKRGYMPNVIFCPIKFMTPMMLGVQTFRAKEGRDYMLTPSGYLEIFWSNNYTPFDDFFMVSKKQFGEWIFKSDSEDRLLTEFTAASSGKHKVVARTVVSYKILREEAGIRVAVMG